MSPFPLIWTKIKITCKFYPSSPYLSSMNSPLEDGLALFFGLLLSLLSMKIPGGARLVYAFGMLILAWKMYADAMHWLWSLPPLVLAPGLLWYGGIMRGVVVLSVLYALAALLTTEGTHFWLTLGALPGFYFLYRKKFEHPFWEGIYMKWRQSQDG